VIFQFLDDRFSYTRVCLFVVAAVDLKAAIDFFLTISGYFAIFDDRKSNSYQSQTISATKVDFFNPLTRTEFWSSRTEDTDYSELWNVW